MKAPAAASASATEATAAKAAPQDIVLLGPPTADGAGVHVIRAREERIETGELRPVEDGRPLSGELVTLEPRKDNPRICDVTQSYAPPGFAAHAQLGHKGPAKVATEAYRENWDEIFGRKPAPSGPAN